MSTRISARTCPENEYGVLPPEMSSQKEMTRPGTLRSRASGFTMIELVVVLLIIAIVTVVVVANSGNTAKQSQLAVQTEIVRSHLHFAKMTAMQSNVPWRINFSNSSYTLQKNGAASTVFFPNVGSATYTLPAGITLTASSNSVVFDEWGSPGASDITVTISNGVTGTTITVNKITGTVS